jgi:Histidine kinase-, DNA gyrase B-, and HSP90-like ATPase
MLRLVLEASDDHVRQIAHEADPTQAVIELIWNGIDAEADRVAVTYVREPHLGGIIEVTVEDAGHGITPDEIKAEFGRIGDSWKSRGDRRSKNGKRRVHGSKGRGRLRAFALGSSVEWTSTALGVEGLKSIRIAGSRNARNIFSSEEIKEARQQETGTIFRAFNQAQKSLVSLESQKSREMISGAFAPILLEDPEIEIRLDGTLINPRAQIANDQTYEESVQAPDGEIPLTIRIIEWKTGTHRQLYFADPSGQISHAEDGQNLEPQFSYSAYISWPGLGDSADLVSLGTLAPEPIPDLVSKASEIIQRHFRSRRRQTRRRQIELWKKQGIYPFEGEPGDETERIERILFDVVSGTLSGQVATTRLEAGLTLRLLQNVLKTQPGDLIAILNEVVSLSSEDLNALVRLLGATSLSSIIKAASLINARQHFLNALDHLIYDPTDKKLVSERRHLHPMLEDELWIFGEEYNLMSSERGLTEMLRNHLRLSGLPAEVGEPVRTWDGKGGRTDLHLGVVTREHDRDRHLIVELKAPGVTITPDELGQVKKYGDVLLDEPRFQSGSASWDLILVGGKLHPRARRDILEDSLDTGKFWEPPVTEPNVPRVRAFVRTWRDIIDDNRRRLAFFTDAMESDPSVAESMVFLKEQYATLLPDGESSGVDSDQDKAAS